MVPTPSSGMPVLLSRFSPKSSSRKGSLKKERLRADLNSHVIGLRQHGESKNSSTDSMQSGAEVEGAARAWYAEAFRRAAGLHRPVSDDVAADQLRQFRSVSDDFARFVQRSASWRADSLRQPAEYQLLDLKDLLDEAQEVDWHFAKLGEQIKNAMMGRREVVVQDEQDFAQIAFQGPPLRLAQEFQADPPYGKTVPRGFWLVSVNGVAPEPQWSVSDLRLGVPATLVFSPRDPQGEISTYDVDPDGSLVRMSPEELRRLMDAALAPDTSVASSLGRLVQDVALRRGRSENGEDDKLFYNDSQWSRAIRNYDGILLMKGLRLLRTKSSSQSMDNFIKAATGSSESHESADQPSPMRRVRPRPLAESSELPQPVDLHFGHEICEWMQGKLKSIGRSSFKVDLRYGKDASQLCDVVRGTLVFFEGNGRSALANMYIGLRNLQHSGLFDCYTLRPLTFDDRYFSPTPEAYRDLQLTMHFHEHVVELQLTTGPMYRAKGRVGHRIYEQTRIANDLLLRAARDNRMEPNEYLEPGVVALLTEHHARPNGTRDKNGKTPLHYACRHNNQEMLGLLLQCRADPCAVDKNGETPMHRAVVRGVLRHLRTRPVAAQFAAQQQQQQQQQQPMHSWPQLGGMDRLVESRGEHEPSLESDLRCAETLLRAIDAGWRENFCKSILPGASDCFNDAENSGRVSEATIGEASANKVATSPFCRIVELTAYCYENVPQWSGTLRLFRLLDSLCRKSCEGFDMRKELLHYLAKRGFHLAIRGVFECQKPPDELFDFLQCNAVDAAGWTPLDHAAAAGDVPTVQTLLMFEGQLHSVSFQECSSTVKKTILRREDVEVHTRPQTSPVASSSHASRETTPATSSFMNSLPFGKKALKQLGDLVGEPPPCTLSKPLFLLDVDGREVKLWALSMKDSQPCASRLDIARSPKFEQMFQEPASDTASALWDALQTFKEGADMLQMFRLKIVMALTGELGQRFTQDVKFRRELLDYFDTLERELEAVTGKVFVVQVFAPSAQDEMRYKLLSTRYFLQHVQLIVPGATAGSINEVPDEAHPEYHLQEVQRLFERLHSSSAEDFESLSWCTSAAAAGSSKRSPSHGLAINDAPAAANDLSDGLPAPLPFPIFHKHLAGIVMGNKDRIRKIFNKIDCDATGVLNCADLQKALATGNPREPEVLALARMHLFEGLLCSKSGCPCVVLVAGERSIQFPGLKFVSPPPVGSGLAAGKSVRNERAWSSAHSLSSVADEAQCLSPDDVNRILQKTLHEEGMVACWTGLFVGVSCFATLWAEAGLPSCIFRRDEAIRQLDKALEGSAGEATIPKWLFINLSLLRSMLIHLFAPDATFIFSTHWSKNRLPATWALGWFVEKWDSVRRHLVPTYPVLHSRTGTSISWVLDISEERIDFFRLLYDGRRSGMPRMAARSMEGVSFTQQYVQGHHVKEFAELVLGMLRSRREGEEVQLMVGFSGTRHRLFDQHWRQREGLMRFMEAFARRLQETDALGPSCEVSWFVLGQEDLSSFDHQAAEYFIRRVDVSGLDASPKVNEVLAQKFTLLCDSCRDAWGILQYGQFRRLLTSSLRIDPERARSVFNSISRCDRQVDCLLRHDARENISSAGLLVGSRECLALVRTSLFRGTVTQGAHSLQVTSRAAIDDETAVRLEMSVSVGASTPDEDRASDSVQRWIARVREAVTSNWQGRSPLQGLFIGFGESHDAARHAKIDGRLLLCSEAVDALERWLVNATQNWHNVSCVVLLLEALRIVFAADALVLFHPDLGFGACASKSSRRVPARPRDQSLFGTANLEGERGGQRRELRTRWPLGWYISAWEDEQQLLHRHLQNAEHVPLPDVHAPVCVVDVCVRGLMFCSYWQPPRAEHVQVLSSTWARRFRDVLEGKDEDMFIDHLLQHLGEVANRAGQQDNGQTATIVAGGIGLGRSASDDGGLGRRDFLNIGHQQKVSGFLHRVERACRRQQRSVSVYPLVMSADSLAEFEFLAIRYLAGATSSWIDLPSAPPSLLQDFLAAYGSDARAKPDTDSPPLSPSTLASPMNISGRLCRLLRGGIGFGGGWFYLAIPCSSPLPMLHLVPLDGSRDADRLMEQEIPKTIWENGDGVFVGTSQLFELVHRACPGLTDRIVQREEVLQAAGSNQMRSTSSVSVNQQAWLLFRAFLEHLQPGQCLLFKRDWHINGRCYTASWGLGWHLQSKLQYVGLAKDE